MSRRYLFTSESVSEGHPDKLADRISDRILDEFLRRDPQARVACETLAADNLVVVAGEFKTKLRDHFDDVEKQTEAWVRDTLRNIGYRDAATGIDPPLCQDRCPLNPT